MPGRGFRSLQCGIAATDPADHGAFQVVASAAARRVSKKSCDATRGGSGDRRIPVVSWFDVAVTANGMVTRAAAFTLSRAIAVAHGQHAPAPVLRRGWTRVCAAAGWPAVSTVLPSGAFVAIVREKFVEFLAADVLDDDDGAAEREARAEWLSRRYRDDADSNGGSGSE